MSSRRKRTVAIKTKEREAYVEWLWKEIACKTDFHKLYWSLQIMVKGLSKE